MRHLKKRKQLSRPSAHRNAVVRNLCKSVIEHDRIKTTKAKAKLVQPFIEKLITRAKDNSLHAKRIVASKLGSWDIIPKLFDQIGPKFRTRNGGYTRIIKIGFRDSDSAEMVLLELLESFEKKEKVKKVDVAATADKNEVAKKESDSKKKDAEVKKEKAKK